MTHRLTKRWSFNRSVQSGLTQEQLDQLKASNDHEFALIKATMVGKS